MAQTKSHFQGDVHKQGLQESVEISYEAGAPWATREKSFTFSRNCQVPIWTALTAMHSQCDRDIVFLWKRLISVSSNSFIKIAQLTCQIMISIFSGIACPYMLNGYYYIIYRFPQDIITRTFRFELQCFNTSAFQGWESEQLLQVFRYS